MNSDEIKKLLGPGYWKRMSKTGTGDGVVRVFRDIKTGRVVTVDAQGKPIMDPTPGLRAKISPKYLTRDSRGMIVFDSTLFLGHLENIPQIPMELDDDCEEAFGGFIVPGDLEELDFENTGFGSLGDCLLVMYAGGDWQNPYELSIGWNELTDKPRVFSYRKFIPDKWINFKEGILSALANQA